jgi:hypothetical protein
MQIKTRGIENNAVTDQKIRLSNNQSIRARNAANTGDIPLLRANTSDLAEFGVKPQSSFTPSLSQDLATLGWVQDYVSGVTSLKEAADCATTGNVALVGAPGSIDSHVLVMNDRVLVKDQTDAKENGIYRYDGTDLVRTADFDGTPASEVKQGVSVDILFGSINGKTRWILTNAAPTVGVSNLTFAEIPAGAIVPVQQEEILSITATDVTNQYKDLSQVVLHASVQVFFSGILQKKGVDYTLSNVAGPATRVTFHGDLASAGNIALVNGDLLTVSYERE